MKAFKKVSGGITFLSLMISLAGVLGMTVPVAHAATSPGLGTAASYSILAGSQVTNTGATTITGDVGISPGIGGPPHYSGFGTVTLGGSIHDADGAALTAQADKDTAFAALAIQGCTTDYGGVTHELAGDILAPGVYCATSFHLTNGVLTLNGPASGVWIFKSASDLIITGSAADVIFSGGGQPCNVWWRVVSTASLDAGSAFVGNILASTSITFAAGASLNGRALASTAEVTLDSAAISGPTCTAAPVGGTTSSQGTINVVKLVINDNGGVGTVGDFSLFVGDTPVDSGVAATFAAQPSTYVVSETPTAGYTATFSGDCDATGTLVLQPDDALFCVITNNDIGAAIAVPPVPPIIDVVKVPSPLNLPDGPGTVTYTYTLRNIGTVPVTDVTMIDDTCTPAGFISGDTDSDAQLDLTETWTYTCSLILDETHTNTVVATGWANGLSASDVAEATVVVGIPLVPPLIHVTKVPSPLTLPAGGGTVTYTETITNPGTVALSNVTLDDDKCGTVNYVSGDTNDDSLLNVTESWVYTCQSNLTATTTNTATATGTANGFTVRDLAIVTVVVAGPTPVLPNAGFGSATGLHTWQIVLAAGLATGLLLVYVNQKKQRA